MSLQRSAGADHLRRRRRRHRGGRPGGRADEGLGRQRPSGPRCSAASAASPGCSTPRALRGMTAPGAGHRTDGVGTKVAIAQAHGRARHHRLRPGRHGRRRHRRLRRRAAVHDRLHRLRQGRARADRRDRQGHRRGVRRRPAAPWSAARPPSTPGCSGRTSTTSPAPRPASSRRRPCSARTGSRPATSWSRWRPRGLHSNGYSLVRHVFAAAGLGAGPRRRRARPHPRRGAAGADPDLRRATCSTWSAPTASTCTPSATSPAAGSRPTWPGCCRAAASRRVDRSTWTPPPVFGMVVRELGRVPVADLERTLNMGVGMVAVVPPTRPTRVGARGARRAACPPGSLGEVSDRASGHGRGRRGGRAAAPRASTAARCRSSARTRGLTPVRATARGAGVSSRWSASAHPHRDTATVRSRLPGKGGSAHGRGVRWSRGTGGAAGRPEAASALAGGLLAVLVVAVVVSVVGDRLRRAVRRSVKLSLKLLRSVSG